MNISIKIILLIGFTLTPIIVMRHDVNESKYLELGQKYGNSVIRLNAGCGTFIKPNWIITAAHTASHPRMGDEVTVHGIKYKIKRKVIHPNFKMNEEHGVINDIALMELEEDIPNVELAILYNKSDEIGKEIIFVGTGWAGTGNRGMVEGEINKDRKMRAAQNKVDGTKSGYLRFTFDAPNSDKALPLEGISGPGDSGGPALWFENDQAYILGVSSHQDYRDKEIEGLYGSYEYYTRVSNYIDWLEKTIVKRN